MKRFLTGSALFFKDYSDYILHDLDYIEVVNSQNKFKKEMPHDGCDVWRYIKATNEEYINYALQSKDSYELGTFLCPSFCRVFNISIEHLKKLESLKNNLWPEHEYLKIIYDSYIENNGFFLKKSQLDKAYKVYKECRNGKC